MAQAITNIMGLPIALIWLDKGYICVEDPYHISRFPRTEAGYRMALDAFGPCKLARPVEDEGDKFLRDLVARNVR